MEANVVNHVQIVNDFHRTTQKYHQRSTSTCMYLTFSLHELAHKMNVNNHGLLLVTQLVWHREKLLNRVLRWLLQNLLEREKVYQRNFARKLTDKDYCISNTAVYRYLRSDFSYTWRNRRDTRIYSKRHKDNSTPTAVKMQTYFKTEFPIVF